MTNYIPADKLIAKIKQLAKTNKELKPNRFTQGIAAGYGDVLSAIASLQQEQPKVDLVAELKHHLATTPKEQLEKEWKELEPWGNIGPTVQEFLYGKQPEVDLKKEIDRWFGEKYMQNMEGLPIKPIVQIIARHFYGLRNRVLEEAARHVYESWIGGTMDDVRRDMVELGKVLNARKEVQK